MFGYIWPTLVPLMYPGTACLAIFQIIPVSPELTLERWGTLVDSSEPNQQAKQLIDYLENVLVEEDVSLCESVQRGLHSRGYRQGRFVVNRDHVEFSEHHVHMFQNLVYRSLTDSD